MAERDSSAAYVEGDPPRRDGAKSRLCLKCKTPFESMWSGERICGHCKRSKAWRSIASTRTYTTGRGY